jgi:hypothetical protein
MTPGTKLRPHTITLKAHLYCGSEMWILSKTDAQEIRAAQ